MISVMCLLKQFEQFAGGCWWVIWHLTQRRPFKLLVMKKFKAKTWLSIAILNFTLVALAGLIMRYKNVYSLPAVDQKNLMHGHSHFAFVGWITMALMTLLVQILLDNQVKTTYRKYNYILLINLLCSYGMYVAFTLQGYAFWSIVLSTMTILLSFVFIYYYHRDLRQLPRQALCRKWLETALLLWAVSAVGAFCLAYLMASRNTSQDLYFMAVYLFLHFQYNGWFLFAAFGIFLAYLDKRLFVVPGRLQESCRRLFVIMAATVAPSYLLSILWLKLPAWVVTLAAVTGIVQLGVLVYFTSIVVQLRKQPLAFGVGLWLWRLAGFAFMAKVLLQACSVFPFFSSFAFSVRPIVIGYLHLCFIGVVSFFILGYISNLSRVSEVGLSMDSKAVYVFLAGFFLQEITLMVQGAAIMDGVVIKAASQLLLWAALLMVLGLLALTTGLMKKRKAAKAAVN